VPSERYLSPLIRSSTLHAEERERERERERTRALLSCEQTCRKYLANAKQLPSPLFLPQYPSPLSHLGAVSAPPVTIASPMHRDISQPPSDRVSAAAMSAEQTSLFRVAAQSCGTEPYTPPYNPSSRSLNPLPASPLPLTPSSLSSHSVPGITGSREESVWRASPVVFRCSDPTMGVGRERKREREREIRYLFRQADSLPPRMPRSDFRGDEPCLPGMTLFAFVRSAVPAAVDSRSLRLRLIGLVFPRLFPSPLPLSLSLSLSVSQSLFFCSVHALPRAQRRSTARLSLSGRYPSLSLSTTAPVTLPTTVIAVFVSSMQPSSRSISVSNLRTHFFAFPSFLHFCFVSPRPLSFSHPSCLSPSY